MPIIRIATRRSPLALWQAQTVAAAITSANPDTRCELVPMVTDGDRFLSAPLTEVGGKNMFIKELEQAMLDGAADIAVHSVKDVTAQLPGGLHLGAFTEREDPRDALVSTRYATLSDLPTGARLGTASSRRQCQVLSVRPDLEVALVRGNVNTRLAKLDAGEYDALILAAAGLKRLGFADRIASCLEPEEMLPAVGQGVMGIECRTDDTPLNQVIANIADEVTTIRVRAERAVNARLGGGCHMPLAAYAEVCDDGSLRLRALVGALDGSTILRAERIGSMGDAHRMGIDAADELLANGAGAFMLPR